MMLIGNVGGDPEVKFANDVKVAAIKVATSERYKDRNGEIQEKTEWHSVVAWRNAADIVEKYVAKGSQVYIEGKLRTRQWEDQNGNKRYSTEVVVDTIQLLGKKPQTQQGAQPQPPMGLPQAPIQQQYPPMNAPEYTQNDNSDLPFSQSPGVRG